MVSGKSQSKAKGDVEVHTTCSGHAEIPQHTMVTDGEFCHVLTMCTHSTRLARVLFLFQFGTHYARAPFHLLY